MEQMINQDMDANMSMNANMGAAKKEGKGMMIGMICCAILALGGIGFGIYGFFFKKPSTSDALEAIKSDSNIETISTVANPEEIDTAKPLEEQEVTVANQYVIDDLDRKISILTGLNWLSDDHKSLINAALAYNKVAQFYNGNLETSVDKAATVFIASKVYFDSNSTWNLENKTDAVSAFIRNNYSDTLDVIKQYYDPYYTISYTLANKLYSGLFNETLPKESIDTGICGYHFSYIPEADTFISDSGFNGVGGCGGTGYSGILVRKDSYKAKGNEAYVYAKIASAHLSEGEGWRVYDDFYDVKWWEDDLSNLTTIDDGSLNIYNGVLQEEPSDYSFMNAATDYRFVFKKSSSGTYYFDKLEKL